jgi:hypothetical protein
VRRSSLENIGFEDLKPDEFACPTLIPSPLKVTAASPQPLHWYARGDFLSPEWFGAVAAPQRAAGFVPHGMRYALAARLKDTKEWTLNRVELVSLLKFDEPRVYVLDHLPRMDQLSGEDVPTRGLDDFERTALEKLWRDEDIVVDVRGDECRMLGSLRAARQCLDCHSVERGELLGAFTYVLRPGENGALGVVQRGSGIGPPKTAADDL